MRRLSGWISAIAGGVWFLLGLIGNFQTAQSIFQDRGATPRAILATLPWSQWIGLVIFLGGIALLTWSYWRRKQPQPVTSQTPSVPAQIWDETSALFKEATGLINQWARSGNPVPPLDATLKWISRFEAFARKHFSLEQIKIVFDPFEMDFRGQLPSVITPKTSEILEAWQELMAYEMHLQSFMRDDLRRPPPTPPPAPRPYRSFKQMMEDQTIVLPSSPIKPLCIEGLPVNARTENQTQLGESMKGGAVFRGKCILSIHNPNPTQGITGLGFRLLSIEPPLLSSSGYRAMTENHELRRIKFTLDDIVGNVLRGDQTAQIHILTAARKPFAEPRTLKNITVEIEGEWAIESKNEFTPRAEHVLTVEATGDGLRTAQQQFKISFSAQFEEDVFTLTKLPS
jgi:hypothetical protein